MGRTTFAPLPDGTPVPFSYADVEPLNEWDYKHFTGEDGTGGGGHRYDSTVPNATKFGASVQTLDELQAVQTSALQNNRLSRHDPDRDNYILRGLATVGGCHVVVDVVIDPNGEPVTVYPVNGDFVRKNDAAGRDGGSIPRDTSFLRYWTPNE
ncbi:MAG: hypothetical protein QM658_09260 [Gordonia sp. (in: high G+C Gram-positive bacteria)]